MLRIAVQNIAALTYRIETGRGQRLATSVHDAVAKNTETDLPDWIYCRLPHHRQTTGRLTRFSDRIRSVSG
jgi:hypothetical protein